MDLFAELILHAVVAGPTGGPAVLIDSHNKCHSLVYTSAAYCIIDLFCAHCVCLSLLREYILNSVFFITYRAYPSKSVFFILMLNSGVFITCRVYPELCACHHYFYNLSWILYFSLFPEHILKALNSLETPEEKLAALCKKYADLHEEHRLLQVKFKQSQKKLTSVSTVRVRCYGFIHGSSHGEVAVLFPDFAINW